MKLIIDVPEEVLDYLQPFKDICYQKIEEGTDSEHEHMLKALYEGIPLDNVKAEIRSKHFHIVEKNDFDNGRTYGYEECLSILDNIDKAESKR